MQIHFDTEHDRTDQAAALVALLTALYSLPPVSRTVTTTTVGAISQRVESTHAENVAAVKQAVADRAETIDAEDSPAAGTATASEVFTQGVPVSPIMTELAGGVSYEAHIENGWTDELLIQHGKMLPPPAPAQAITTAAAVFGGAGGPLVPTNGAPPAPNSNASTLPLQAQDAASVFGAASATPAQSADAATNVVVPIGNALLDSEGLPWDGRIHAATRTTTAKGTWKKKKGVSEEEAAPIVAQLRAAVAANKAAEHRPLNAAPPPPPAAAVAPPPPPAAAVAPPPGPVDFAAVATYVGSRNFDAATIQRVMQSHGLAGLSLLVNAPNLCAPVMASFQAIQ